MARYRPLPRIAINFIALANSCCGVNQPEDVVENEVASLTIGEELEGLGVAHGLLLIINLKTIVLTKDQALSKEKEATRDNTNEILTEIAYQKSTSDHDKDTACIARRLSIKGRNLMYNFLEGKVLPKAYGKHPIKINPHGNPGYLSQLTVSFSTIPATP